MFSSVVSTNHLNPFVVQSTMKGLAIILAIVFGSAIGQQRDIRLRGGRTESEGRVEVLQQGRWVAVCDIGFNRPTANVVCRQLGYDSSIVAVPRSSYGIGYMNTWITRISCTGSEQNLDDCPRATTPIERAYCDYNKQAGVRCVPRRLVIGLPQVLTTTTKKPAETTPPATTTTTTEAPTTTTKGTLPEGYNNLQVIPTEAEPTTVVQLAAVRLKFQFFTGAMEGQLDSGKWISLCGKGWNMANAIVACRETNLGHPKRIATVPNRGRPEEMISRIECKGSERSIHECAYYVEECSTLAFTECSRFAPDLILDIPRLQRSIQMKTQHGQNLQCAMEERCLSPSGYTRQGLWGYRYLLIFSTMIFNYGTADLRPPKHSRDWEWHACHRHYHSIDEFASYHLLDPEGNQVGEGHKVSFCLRDDECPRGRRKYSCDNVNFRQQGISVGCGDLYEYCYGKGLRPIVHGTPSVKEGGKDNMLNNMKYNTCISADVNTLDCQWIDVTDFRPGRYILQIVVNPIKLFSELNYANNEVRCNIEITPYRAAFAYQCWYHGR